MKDIDKEKDTGGTGSGEPGGTPGEKRHLTSAERQLIYAERARHRTEGASNRKRRRKILLLSLIAALALLAVAATAAAVSLNRTRWKPARLYRQAEDYYSAGEYLKAYDIFRELGNYSDSAKRAEDCIIENARKLSGRTDPVIGDSSSMKWFSLSAPDGSVNENEGYIKFDESLYNGPTDVVIPDIFDGVLVRGICDKCFFWCEFMTSVEIPASVTYIGERAFFACSGLRSVTIPDSVETVGENAFAECSGLTSVRIGAGISELPPRAFKDCVSLTSVDLPEGLKTIGVRAFNGCEGIKTVSLPSSLEFIGNYAFTGCVSLEKVIFAGTREKLAALCAADDGSILLDCPGLVTGG